MDGRHDGGLLEYDVHDFFGFMESDATHSFLKKKSSLPFILSRSTAPGSGKFTALWNGDNMSTWDFLKISV